MRKIFTTLVFVLLILVLIIFASPVRGVTRKVSSPLYLALQGIADKIVFPFRTITNLSHLAKENKSLEEENLTLKAEVARLKEIEQRSQLLEKELGFLQSQPQGEYKPTRIVGKAPLGQVNEVVIEGGEKDGFEGGEAVVAQGYFVGSLKEVDKSFSVVKLITSHTSAIPVILSSSRANGILKGGLKGLVVEQLPAELKIETGEDVTTSGLGGKIQSGILVGKVSSLEASPGGIFQKVKVTSPIDFSRLEMVFVVK